MNTSKVRGLAASLVTLADQSRNHEVPDETIQSTLHRWGVETVPVPLSEPTPEPVPEPIDTVTDYMNVLVDLRERVTRIEQWARGARLHP